MGQTQSLMAGKRGLIMGVANDRSIAWGIAAKAHAHGAELAFTYQGEALAKRVRPLAESVGSDLVLPCDVADDASIDATFEAITAIVPHEATLKLYQVHAVTGGTDAQAEVTVRLEEAGKSVNGQGADYDTLVASARAYVNALNKLLVKREKSAPAAISA